MIIAPPSAICWSSWPRDPEPEQLRREQVRVDQGGLALRACGAPASTRTRPSEIAPIARSSPTASPPSCHDEDAQHEAAHAEDGEDGADDVDLPRPGVRHVADEPAAGQHDRDDDDLEQNATPHEKNVVMNPPMQRSDRGGDGGRGPTRA